MKKIISSLHRKKLFINNKNMLRTILHIEAANWFSPKGCDTISGACIADS
jgi:hypothetical protein